MLDHGGALALLFFLNLGCYQTPHEIMQTSLLEFKWPHLCSGSGGLTPYVIDASFEDEDAEEDEEDETPPSAVHFSSIWEASLNPGHKCSAAFAQRGQFLP